MNHDSIRTYTSQIVKGFKGVKKYEILPIECKICRSTEDLEIHHEIYPATREEIICAIKDQKIYYLCQKCHINKSKSNRLFKKVTILRK